MSPQASSGGASTPWFGVSMGLLGVIVGFSVATVTPSQFSGSVPTPPPPSPDRQVPAPPASQGSPIDFFVTLAQGAGFDEADFRECLETDKFAKDISDEMAGGSSAGVQGTPGHVIVHTKTGVGYLVSGAVPQPSFEAVIDAILKGEKPGADAPVASNFPPIGESDHIRGSADAEVAIIAYSDYQCPFCSRNEPTLKALGEKYAGKLQVIHRHFPLSFHPSAQKAAESVECAADQKGDKGFWDMHDLIFQNQGSLPS